MGDLAMALGQPGDVTGVTIDNARDSVLAAGQKQGKLVGAFAYGLDLAREYMANGLDMISIGNDIKLLRESIERSMALVRSAAD